MDIYSDLLGNFDVQVLVTLDAQEMNWRLVRSKARAVCCECCSCCQYWYWYVAIVFKVDKDSPAKPKPNGPAKYIQL